MTNYPLILNQDGVYFLSNGKQRGKKLATGWRFFSSTCYISRSSYWETVTSYPTANLFEVYKIVTAEIPHISPVSGDVRAYVIGTVKQKTYVLFCCFSVEIMNKASFHSLWRLIPETLPIYRQYLNTNKSYLIDVALSPYPLEDGFESHLSEINNKLLVNVSPQRLASLPFDSNARDDTLPALCETAEKVDNNAYFKILKQPHPMKIVDVSSQFISVFKRLFKNNKKSALYGVLFLGSVLLTYVIGKSSYLLLQEQQLSAEVTQTKRAASDVLILANNLKKYKSDITLLNEALLSQTPKAQLLMHLSSLLDLEISVEFKTIDIMPTGVKVTGTVTSATILLAKLAEISGIKNVEFISPPATTKEGAERFNIYFDYDENAFLEEVNNGK